MRKRIISEESLVPAGIDVVWLPIAQIALVEVTSEDASHPVEHALLPHQETGWRAGRPGEQTIRLIFDSPQPLRRIQLLFIEREVERSQEFVLRWTSDNAQTFHEIVRQQWNFNLHDSSQEVEDYHVELYGVTQLELKIVPDRSGRDAYATLEQFRLA